MRFQANTFDVLVVCTGNVCRSPMAASLLLAGLAVRLPPSVVEHFHVSGAGTHAWAGEPMRAHGAAALRERGVSPVQTVGQDLTTELVSAADLVLGAERAHRAAAVTADPSAAGRTFTLRELARLAAAVDPAILPGRGADPVQRARAAVAAASAQRGLLPPVAPAELEVADPMGADLPAFRRCADDIEQALVPALNLLAGPPR